MSTLLGYHFVCHTFASQTQVLARNVQLQIVVSMVVLTSLQPSICTSQCYGQPFPSGLTSPCTDTFSKLLHCTSTLLNLQSPPLSTEGRMNRGNRLALGCTSHAIQLNQRLGYCHQSCCLFCQASVLGMTWQLVGLLLDSNPGLLLGTTGAAVMLNEK